MDERERFEHAFLPHLDAAYNLARWLTGHDQDAEDIVQAAYLRAFRSFSSYRGVNSRGWLMAIVRNTGLSWLQERRAHGATTAFDEKIHSAEAGEPGPQERLLSEDRNALVRRAVEQLPPDLREVIVLRELEGLSYKEIAAIIGVPMGTVMSRLSRARERLRSSLADIEEEPSS
jgi:RNA polymerase sigma-70 factor (ECF subfamily)